MLSTSASCGRAITCDDTSSPTAFAAADPASTAARTLPTSPRTIAVTKPPPICTVFTSSTLAAFTIASHASTSPTRPFVSINPIASLIWSPLLGSGSFPGRGLPVLLDKRGQFVVGAQDHLNADPLADSECRFSARVSGCLDRGHVPFHEGSHQSGTDGLPAGERYVCGFEHGVGGFKQRYQALRLNHSKRLFHRFLSSSVALLQQFDFLGQMDAARVCLIRIHVDVELGCGVDAHVNVIESDSGLAADAQLHAVAFGDAEVRSLGRVHVRVDRGADEAFLEFDHALGPDDNGAGRALEVA